MLARLAPGLAAILASDRAGILADLRAGLSVAAVALPMAVAFAGLMGLPAESGLHASILPMAAYAVFGASRRLIVAPDTATCVLVAGSLSALGLADPDMRLAFAGVLAVLAGLFFIAAFLLRLGALADFLSWPILVGFLNGVALDLMVGQLPRMLGIAAPDAEAVLRLPAIIANLGATHGPTALVGGGTLLLVQAVRQATPSLPASLIGAAAAIGASIWFGLEARGVEVLGRLPAEAPGFVLPAIEPALLLAKRYEVLQHAAGIALISFASFMIPARAFAARRGEVTDPDREALALGLANITAGLAQGFPVSGTSSRTAVAEAAGAQGPLCALVAAGAIVAAMLTLQAPLAALPRAAMAALVMQAALSLIDPGAVRRLWRIERSEAAICLLASAGVLLAGPLNAVLISVVLAVVRFIRVTARPVAEVLGRVPGLAGFHAIDRHAQARPVPGMLFFRFNAPVVFFNARAFETAALAAADRAAPGLCWFVLDSYPITQVDTTGYETLRRVRARLAERGVSLVLAGRRTETLAWMAARGIDAQPVEPLIFPTMNAARRAFAAGAGAAAPAPADPPQRA